MRGTALLSCPCNAPVLPKQLDIRGDGHPASYAPNLERMKVCALTNLADGRAQAYALQRGGPSSSSVWRRGAHPWGWAACKCGCLAHFCLVVRAIQRPSQEGGCAAGNQAHAVLAWPDGLPA